VSALGSKVGRWRVASCRMEGRRGSGINRDRGGQLVPSRIHTPGLPSGACIWPVGGSGVAKSIRMYILCATGVSPMHPDKHVRRALQYAFIRGWRARPAGGHALCILFCPAAARDGCRKSVWSTPRNPEAHAKDIIRAVDRCPH